MALLTNTAIAVAKVAGFVITGSAAILAEAVHSATGAGTQGLLLRGGARAARAPDDDHRFGSDREHYFWSLAVPVVLFPLAAMFAVHQGLDGLDRPEPITDPEWALGILAGAFVVKLASWRVAIREARKAKGEVSYRKFVRRARTPGLPVVLVQDLGALAGLVVALAGVGATVATDDGRWDAYGTLGVGVVLGAMAVFQVLEMKSLLVGRRASAKEVESVRAAIEIDPDIVQILHLHTQYLGPDELMMGAKVEMQSDLTLVQVADTVSRVGRHVRNAVPTARHVFLEPDVDDDHRQAPGYVAEHSGRIDPDDPRYAAITGRPVDPDDDIWTE